MQVHNTIKTLNATTYKDTAFNEGNLPTSHNNYVTKRNEI